MLQNIPLPRRSGRPSSDRHRPRHRLHHRWPLAVRYRIPFSTSNGTTWWKRQRKHRVIQSTNLTEYGDVCVSTIAVTPYINNIRLCKHGFTAIWKFGFFFFLLRSRRNSSKTAAYACSPRRIVTRGRRTTRKNKIITIHILYTIATSTVFC